MEKPLQTPYFDLFHPVEECLVKTLRMTEVFQNYDAAVLFKREQGRKNIRKLNQELKLFWTRIDLLVEQRIGLSFFAWFDLKYFQEELPIDDVHQRFLSLIQPLSLPYSAFFKFITRRAFLPLRDRSSGQYTEIAQKRLIKRESPILTSEQMSQRALKGWETKRAKQRQKMEVFLEMLPE